MIFGTKPLHLNGSYLIIFGVTLIDCTFILQC